MPVAFAAALLDFSVNAAPVPAFVSVVWDVPELLAWPRISEPPAAPAAGSGFPRAFPASAPSAAAAATRTCRRERGVAVVVNVATVGSTSNHPPNRAGHGRPPIPRVGSGIAPRSADVEGLQT